MPPRGFLFSIVVSLALLVAWEGVARCQPPVAAPASPTQANAAPADRARLLKDARALVSRQEYRQAQRMLSDALQELTVEKRGTRPAPTDLALMTTLGEVLVNSGKYQQALSWLERAQRAYEQTGDPTRPILADQAATAIWLSKAYGHLDKTEPAVSAVRSMLGRYQKAKIVDPVVELELLAQLSSFDERTRTHATNASLVEEFGHLAEQLAADQQRATLGGDDYARGLTALADCQLHLAQWTAFVQTTEKVIGLRSGRHEIFEELSARRRLAEMYRRRAEYQAEIETLRAALEVVKRQPQGQSIAVDLRVRLGYERAEIERLLVPALLSDDHRDKAVGQLTNAQEDFAAALALARQVPAGNATGVSEGRLLERIADVMGQRLEMGMTEAGHLDRAITTHAELLDNYRQTLLADDPRIGSLELILGGLHLKAGDWSHAEPLLQEALSYWRRREPRDAFRVAQALHLLGEAALAAVPSPAADKIEQYLRESHSLCLAHFPDDPLRWRTQLALGRLAVATGRYRQALESLRELAAAEASVPNDVCAAALLQMGLLHKQLLRFDEADQLCRAGLKLRERALGDADPELAPFFLALGSLQVARRNATALDECVAQAAALGVAQSKNSAWRWEFAHQQAMAHYLRNERASDAKQRQAARADWQQLLADEPDLPTASKARTLHYLSRLDYLDWSGELEAWNREFAGGGHLSREMTAMTEQLANYQKEQAQFLTDFAAYDPTRAADKKLPDREKQFRELQERRTALETKRGKLRAEHAALLEKEKEQAQAESGVQKTWLAKLTAGRKLADEAIALLERQGIYPSLQFTAMCNAAQLIEAQSRYTPQARDAGIGQALAKLDAAVVLIERQRTNAFGDDVARSEFFAQYHTAFDLLVQFHLDAQARASDDEHLVQALVAAEQSRSRALLDQLRMAYIEDPAAAPAEKQQPTPQYLAGLIRRWRDSKQPLLYYYVGSARSYLFLLGGSNQVIQPLRLQTGPEAADFSTTASDASARWIDMHVNRVHASLSDPRSAAAIVSDPALRQRLAASSLVLLPRTARQYLAKQRQFGAAHVVVVSHGAVSQLPLEALVIDEPEHLYLADVCLPLAYAPSLALLDHLSRSAPQPPPTASVLTLGNPKYAADANREGDDRFAALVELPDSQKECDRIEASFGKQRVTKLDRDRASEAGLRAALHGQRFAFVHLAAHGVLEKNDLNPWLALARGADKDLAAEADGRLDLGEIYRLDLSGCELVVLSACNTNLDARQTARLHSMGVEHGDKSLGLAAPALDSGFSIANAFLAAGSRRVVGTQWTVSDDSTAELVARFFEKLHAQLAAARPINYAALLAEAREELRRDKPEWNTPFHWAPFVLIGPANSAAAR